MRTRYYTKSGSLYTRTTDQAGHRWHKQDKNGLEYELAGAMHLSRRRLQTLITDYPVKALDRTACFGEGIAKEFFDDVKREQGTQVPESEESTIFFLIDRGLGQYSIGYSSLVERIEIFDADQAHDIREAAASLE